MEAEVPAMLQAQQAQLLKEGLQTLANNDNLTRTIHTGLTLEETIDHLPAQGSKLLTLKTDSGHEILVGTVESNNQMNHQTGRKFVISDPHTGTFIFKSKNEMALALNKYLLTNNLAEEFYGAKTNHRGKLIFDVAEINPEVARNTSIGKGLTVNDLISSRPLKPNN